jgi:hypothetical protein
VNIRGDTRSVRNGDFDGFEKLEEFERELTPTITAGNDQISFSFMPERTQEKYEASFH